MLTSNSRTSCNGAETGEYQLGPVGHIVLQDFYGVQLSITLTQLLHQTILTPVHVVMTHSALIPGLTTKFIFQQIPNTVLVGAKTIAQPWMVQIHVQ